MDPRKALLLFVTLVLCVVVAFCFFGFLATFEPLEEGRAATWRVVYGIVGGLSVLSILLVGSRFRRIGRARR